LNKLCSSKYVNKVLQRKYLLSCVVVCIILKKEGLIKKINPFFCLLF
ncbi:MAG: hypothetical protein ACI86H_001898, partial [bacterium]